MHPSIKLPSSSANRPSPRSIHFESKSSAAVRRRLSSVVASQKPNVATITAFASLTVRS